MSQLHLLLMKLLARVTIGPRTEDSPSRKLQPLKEGEQKMPDDDFQI